MQCFLVQHGEAAPEAQDPARPLTERGREEVGRVARHAARLGLGPAGIWHSGKLRAQQTAEIFAEHLQFRNAGIVCLARGEGGWRLDWALPPNLVPGGAGR